MKLTDWRTITDEREKYAAYLQSREWSDLRNAVKKRCGGICERCRKSPVDAVHHLTYMRKYNERLEDLAGWCDECHKFTHGRSDHDPAEESQLLHWGGLYLAGKVRGRGHGRPDWRSEFIDLQSIGAEQAYDNKWGGAWPEARNAVTVGNYQFDYLGPYTIACDHGCFHSAPHAFKFGPHAICGSEAGSPPDHRIVDACQDAIRRASTIFAWMDTEDCFGTIAEIGFAAGLAKRPLIFVAGPKMFKELWFTYALASFTEFDEQSPYGAFSKMLNAPAVVHGAA